MKKQPDDLDRKKVADKYSDKEMIDMPKQFRQRKEGKMRMLQTLEDVVEQDKTYPDKPKADRFKHIKKFLSKK